jgi:hypothetical protein
LRQGPRFLFVVIFCPVLAEAFLQTRVELTFFFCHCEECFYRHDVAITEAGGELLALKHGAYLLSFWPSKRKKQRT